MKQFKETLTVEKSFAQQVRHYCNDEPNDYSECLGEDETFIKTVKFADGVEMDIKCCGVEYEEGESNLAWTEAVLFRNGYELCCSEPSDDFFGEWQLETADAEYIVIVKEEE